MNCSLLQVSLGFRVSGVASTTMRDRPLNAFFLFLTLSPSLTVIGPVFPLFVTIAVILIAITSAVVVVVILVAVSFLFFAFYHRYYLYNHDC